MDYWLKCLKFNYKAIYKIIRYNNISIITQPELVINFNVNFHDNINLLINKLISNLFTREKSCFLFNNIYIFNLSQIFI